MEAELRIFRASPSVKGWPIPLALGAFIALTGAISLVLLIAVAKTALTIVFAGLAVMAFPVVKAANTEYEGTNLRIVFREGPFPRRVSELRVSEIREVRVVRTPVQQMLGVGDLELVCAGGVLRMRDLEEPEKLRDKILTVR